MVNIRRTWAVGALRLTLPHRRKKSFSFRSLGKPIAKVDFWTTHDAPWSHGSQITDAGNSPPRVRVGPHDSALGGGLGLWVPTFALATISFVTFGGFLLSTAEHLAPSKDYWPLGAILGFTTYLLWPYDWADQPADFEDSRQR